MSALITNHQGFKNYASEALAVTLLVYALCQAYFELTTTLQASMIFLSSFFYIFTRICKMKRWHKNSEIGTGIEKHFADVQAVNNYILILGLAIYLLFANAIPLILANIVLLFLSHFHFVLIFFAHKDQDKTPVNFYSSGKFLH